MTWRFFKSCRVALIAWLIMSLSVPAALAQSASLTPSPSVTTSPSGPKLLVMIVPLDSIARGQTGFLEHFAEVAIDGARRFELLRATNALDPTAADQRARAAKNGVQSLKDGQLALEDLDAQKATSLLNDAIESFRKADMGEHWADYLRARLLRASAYAGSGEALSARDEIERVLALDGKTAFDASLFPPEFLKYAEAQRKALASAKGNFTVRTEPTAAPVMIDGVYRGLSPVTVSGFAAQKHVVSISLSGYGLAQDELMPGEHTLRLKPAELGSVIQRTESTVAGDVDGPGRDPAVVSLGKSLEADQVLLIIAKKNVTAEKLDVTLVRIETRDGHNVGYKTASIGIGDDSGFIATLNPVLNRDIARSGKAPVTQTKATATVNSTKRAVGISLLVAGAVMLGAGIASGVQASGAVTEFKAIPQTHIGPAEAVAARGRSFAIVADVSYIISGIALVAGTIVTATSGGSTTSDEVEAPKKGRGRRDSVDDSAGRRASDSGGRSDARARDDERQREDERRRTDDKQRDEERRRNDDKQRDEERRRNDEKQREDERRRNDEKQREEERRRNDEKQREEERRRNDEKQREEERRRNDEKQREDERRREEDRLKAEKDAEAKQREEDERAKADADDKKKPRNKREEAAMKKKEEEERKKKEEEDKRKAEEDAKRKKEEEDRRRKEEEAERKRLEEKRRNDSVDDLRNE